MRLELLHPRDFPLWTIEVQGNDGVYQIFTAAPFRSEAAAAEHLVRVRVHYPSAPADQFRVSQVYTLERWRKDLLEQVRADNQVLRDVLETVPNRVLCWALLRAGGAMTTDSQEKGGGSREGLN
jgi:hypothetical protein